MDDIVECKAMLFSAVHHAASQKGRCNVNQDMTDHQGEAHAPTSEISSPRSRHPDFAGDRDSPPGFLEESSTQLPLDEPLPDTSASGEEDIDDEQEVEAIENGLQFHDALTDLEEEYPPLLSSSLTLSSLSSSLLLPPSSLFVDMACLTLTSAGPRGIAAGGSKGLRTAFSLEELSPEDCEDLTAACFPVNGRSKSFGNSVSKAFTEAVSKLEMGHDSRNKQFHKLFPCVPDTESVINTYSCALVRDILLQGRLFVSENWLCFHSNIFTYEKQVAIRVETITKLTKERTAFVVPNAIGIQTPTEKHIFGSLLSRQSTHQLLYRVWKNAKGETESMTPESSLHSDSDSDGLEDDSYEQDGPDGQLNGPVHSVDDVRERLEMPSSEQLLGSRYHHGESPHFLPSSPEHSHSTSGFQGPRHRSHTGYHHWLHQKLCSVSIFKSIMRLGSSLKQLPQYQPFLFLIGILLVCLTFSAAVLSVRIWHLQPNHVATTSQSSTVQDSTHYDHLENIGNLFLSQQHQHQEQVSHIQDTLVANLKALLQVQSSLKHLNKKSSSSSSSPSSSMGSLPTSPIDGRDLSAATPEGTDMKEEL